MDRFIQRFCCSFHQSLRLGVARSIETLEISEPGMMVESSSDHDDVILDQDRQKE